MGSTFPAEATQEIGAALKSGEVINFDDGLAGEAVEGVPQTYKGKVIRFWTVHVGRDAWRSLVKIEQAQ